MTIFLCKHLISVGSYNICFYMPGLLHVLCFFKNYPQHSMYYNLLLRQHNIPLHTQKQREIQLCVCKHVHTHTQTFFFSYSTIAGYLPCFHLLATVNNAVRNTVQGICMHLSLILLGNQEWNCQIICSSLDSIFNFLGNCQTVFQAAAPFSHSCQWYTTSLRTSC